MNTANHTVSKLKPIDNVHTLLLKMMIKRMKGKFFSATVITEKGVRHFNATTNTRKFNKGIVKRKQKDNLVLVYDNYAKSVRTINLDNLQSFSCGKVKWEV